MARGHRELPLKELLEFLEEQYAECEGVAKVRQRLRILDIMNERRKIAHYDNQRQIIAVTGTIEMLTFLDNIIT